MRINDAQIVIKDDFMLHILFSFASFEDQFEENNFVYFERRVFIKEWLMEIAIVNVFGVSFVAGAII